MKRIPPASGERPPRSVWFDPRFGIGITLVIASVLGVGVVVTAADQTTEVWAARSALSPGDLLDADTLERVPVRLGATAGQYLAVSALREGALVVTRSVSAGELVPLAALGSATAATLAPVVVRTGHEVPRSVEAGAVVDLWAAAAIDGGGFGPPVVLASSAIVARLITQDGLMASGRGTAVEILVPREKVALVLGAIDNSAAMSLVPVSLPVGG